MQAETKKERRERSKYYCERCGAAIFKARVHQDGALTTYEAGKPFRGLDFVVHNCQRWQKEKNDGKPE